MQEPDIDLSSVPANSIGDAEDPDNLENEIGPEEYQLTNEDTFNYDDYCALLSSYAASTIREESESSDMASTGSSLPPDEEEEDFQLGGSDSDEEDAVGGVEVPPGGFGRKRAPFSSKISIN